MWKFNAALEGMSYSRWVVWHMGESGMSRDELYDAGFNEDTWKIETLRGTPCKPVSRYFEGLKEAEDLKADKYFTETQKYGNGMYTLSNSLSDKFGEVFKPLLPSIKFKSKLGFLSQLIHHPDFTKHMKEYTINRRTEIVDYLADIISTKLTPFTEVILYCGGVSNSRAGISSMLNLWLKRMDEASGIIDSIEVVGVSRKGIMLRYSTLNRRQFNYMFMRIEGESLTLAQWQRIESLPGIEGCHYYPKLDTMADSHSFSHSRLVTLSKEELLVVMKGGTPRWTSPTESYVVLDNRMLFDVYETSDKSFKNLSKNLKTGFGLDDVNLYNIDELRVAKEGEKPQVFIGIRGKKLNFKSKKGLDLILSIVLRSFPMMAYKNQLHYMKVVAPSLSEDGTFDVATPAIYNGVYYSSGRTLFLELQAFEYNIVFGFLLTPIIIDIKRETLTALSDIVSEEFNELKLDSIKDYRVLSDTIHSQNGKIARKMVLENILTSDSFLVDGSLKSFFDGLKSSLEKRIDLPKKVNGRVLDPRITPMLHAKAIKGDRDLLGIVQTITNRNYYNGGVNVNIIRS